MKRSWSGQSLKFVKSVGSLCTGFEKVHWGLLLVVLKLVEEVNSRFFGGKQSNIFAKYSKHLPYAVATQLIVGAGSVCADL